MAIYIDSVTLVSPGADEGFRGGIRRTCYSTMYPFGLFPQKELLSVEFAPITLLYGGNGSGKSTLLNIIAEKAHITRRSAFAGSAFFSDYVEMCGIDYVEIPSCDSQILTSDDVSDYLIDMRYMNRGIDARREELFEEYLDRKYKDNRFTSLEDYDRWKEGYDSRRTSQSRFVKDRLMQNVDTKSNGETAMRYFTERVTENALYLLDEPENSLSIKLQTKLARFLTDSARFFGCQLIIATHSPVFLAIQGARIYDLDSYPVETKKWSELENVRAYFDFFESHRSEFTD